MSTIKVNTVTKRTGSTLTLGESGTTVTLACGATQSGFGRTGTVDWCTTAKTSPFTAVSGNGYFVNTTSGGVTVTLPSSPSAGDIVAVSDYAKTAATNNITICRNSSKIEGSCGNKAIADNGDAITLVYVDATKGWKLVNTADQDILKGAFVEATGGNTILTCGNFKTHIFTADGNFEVVNGGTSSGSNTVEYLVVAGGAGGGDGSGSGGGGAGGYRTTYPSPATGGLPVSAQTYAITVGAGGAFSCSPSAKGTSGGVSTFSSITSAGGGGGGSESTPAKPGASGGSGGGGQSNSAGGAGNTPPTSPSQGNAGGAGGGCYSGGGGGGAGAVGFQGKPSAPGAGGDGAPIADVFFGPTAPSYGTPGPSTGRYFAGGGGGGNQPPASPAAAQTGGAGGGGTGAVHPNTQAIAGTANTGGGGGGGISAPVQPNGSGGSGFVAIRYKFQ